MVRPPASPNLVMIGFMGAGKTMIGKLVAQALGREFLDTDELVTQAAELPITEIFRREGEDGFRRREQNAIDEAVASPARVIAVGGGAVLSSENRTVLKQAGYLVYLRATPETLAIRLADVTDRPLINAVDRVGRIRDLLVARGPVYETAGDVAVDTDTITPQQAAEQIVHWYRDQVDQGRL
ncbi:MAG TPA: shikimate kinase [Actinomycetes bacterium]|nr:shikimate kinase [Actinomycetes bacterium]